MQNQSCKLILALDLPDRESAINFLEQMRGSLEWVKIGLQMYLKYGASFVEEIASMGFKIFLDLKLYDIPNTVSSAIESVATLPISMLTIHAHGGALMMQNSVEKAKQINPELQILAVTVLTSFSDEALAETGIATNAKEQVCKLAKLAKDNSITGLVCSPQELDMLREFLTKEEMILVTPGIRPLGSDANEQKRIMTPIQATQKGASYIVVGRPILKAGDPVAVAKSIIAEIS